MEDLHEAIERSLDALLAALELRPLGNDRFVAESGVPGHRVFGGQLLAQAVVGASATVADREIQSLHAAFVRTGSPGASVEIQVTRLRDGRSLANREVRILEAGAPLLVAITSFGARTTDIDIAPPGPRVTSPDEMPLLQSQVGEAPNGRHWIEEPPAVEFRLPEPPSFISGATATNSRSHWMRLPRSVGDEPGLQAALLAYASDFFLMDMVFRLHPDGLGPGKAGGFSLDHAIWFHRPVRFETWHLHTQEALALVGDRGLARGTIHDGGGRCVASVIQEVLLRLGTPS